MGVPGAPPALPQPLQGPLQLLAPPPQPGELLWGVHDALRGERETPEMGMGTRGITVTSQGMQ